MKLKETVMFMTADPSLSQAATPAQRLHRKMAAVRVSCMWMGMRRSLTPQQKDEAAESFGAEGQFLSAAKKLLDTRDPAYRKVTSIRSRALGYWRVMSLPYPEPGMRLIRQDRVAAFHQQMTDYQSDLARAVNDLDACYAQMREAARERLGRLYSPVDYPPSLQGLFAITWDFPSVEPPEYLMQLNPALYEQERTRMVARFEEAVKLVEETFTSEFSNLLNHLVERLGSGEEGTQKVFRDSLVTNLTEFFQRFRSLNVRSNDQLDELVTQAQQIVAGVGPQALRDSGSLRQSIRTQLSGVQSVLEGMLVDRPRRRILRSTGQGA
jgi:hypothetical protein